MMPGARKVTGETSVPSRSRVSRPASSPRVTQGSGIGSQARSTCGIWIRWSIRARPAKPIRVRRPGQVDQPAVGSSSGHGNRETCRITSRSDPLGPTPARVRDSGRRRPVARCGRRPVRVSMTRTWSQPSSSASATRLRTRRSCSVITGAGTGRSRSRLRCRQSAARGVHDHQHGGQPGRPGQPQVVVAPVGVQTEGVDHGGQPAPGPGGDDLVEQVEGLGRRVQVGRSAADDCPQRVGGDDLGGPEPGRGPGRLARSRRAGQHDHGRVGQPGHGHRARSRVLRAPRGCKGSPPSAFIG